MDDKYIQLLLEKCTRIKKNKILFIYYSIEIDDFVKKLVESAKKMGVEEVYLDSYDIEERRKFLKENSIEEIKNSKYFDKSIWDTYAKKNACFLIIETEYPGIMDDVTSEKISISSRIARETRPLYRKMVEKCELSWCVAAYPGKIWAQNIFKDENSYQKLKDAIFRMCMIDDGNPIKEWDAFLNKQRKIQMYLNSLELKKLHYTNSLGTDLEVCLPENYLYSSALDDDIIVNMPSYEVFTSPVFYKTEGIVYASKSLMYNGALIQDFWIKFHHGKVVEFDAKVGRDVLKEIIESDSHSCYLGECAFVENNSPIAKESIEYGTTLIDENASCHLALGAGFAECIKGGLELSDEELLKSGINVSKNHVDFMIGTPDLRIEGITKDNRIIPIFTDGNFDKNIMNEVFHVY